MIRTTILDRTKGISRWQFAAFRIVFGLALVLHFALLLTRGAELCSREGLLRQASFNLTHGLLPNPLERWDSPAFTTTFLAVMVALSVAITLGVMRRTACVLLCYGLACLFDRNDPSSFPYVGVMLLLMALVPPGEPLALRRRAAGGERSARGAERAPWRFPWMIFFAAWTLLAVGYTFSGLDKLLSSPSWQNGTALRDLVESPIARPGVMRDLLAKAPDWLHAAMTWSVLGVEVLFLPLCLWRWTRLVAWTLMIGMHLGIALVIDVADLTFWMILAHLFVFDPDWLPARRRAAGTQVVFFDGVCALCHASMRALIDEDRAGVLAFAPLQGETFETLRSIVPLDRALDSMVYVRGVGSAHPDPSVRSRAVARVLDDIGGFWRVVAWILYAVPRPLGDWLYDRLAANRYRWFGRTDVCRLPTPPERQRLLP